VLKSSSNINPFAPDEDDFSIKDIKVDEIVEISRELIKVNL